MPVGPARQRPASSARTAPRPGRRWQDLGELFHLGHLQPSDGQASAISRPMYPAPTMIAVAGAACSRVAHRRRRCRPSSAAGARPSPGPRAVGSGHAADRGRTGTARCGRRACRSRAVPRRRPAVVTRSFRPGTSMRRAVVSSRSRVPAASRLGDAAVGQVAPVGDLAGQVVGDAADGEVRVGVFEDYGDIGGRVELAGAQGGADRVAAADHDQVHGRLPVGLAGQRDRAGPGGASADGGTPSWAARAGLAWPWWGTVTSAASAG